MPPQGSLVKSERLQEFSPEILREDVPNQDSERSHDISYLKFISDLHKILESDIRVDRDGKKPWIEKVEVVSPIVKLSLEGAKVDESKHFYSGSSNQKKWARELFSHFFSQDWTAKQELSLSSELVDTKFDAIGNQDKTELIFHRRDRGNTFYLSITFNVPMSNNRIYLGEESSKDRFSEIDREFSELFLNLSADNSQLYKWIHIIAKCIKNGRLEEEAAKSFYEYYHEYELRQELCEVISKFSSEAHSCLILS